MPSSHWPPTTLLSCGSAAILRVVPWQHALPSLGTPSNRLPGCTTPLGGGRRMLSKRNGVQGCYCRTVILFLSAQCVSSLSTALNIPRLCVCSTSVSICTSLFLSVSFISPSLCLPGVLSLFSHPCSPCPPLTV